MATAELHPTTSDAPHPRRWTREEYYQMSDLGLFQGQRVELIEGEVIVMAAQRHPHAACVTLSTTALIQALGPEYTVRVQAPLALGGPNDPEPGFAIIRGSQRDYDNHPTDALLVIEVSDTTLNYDRICKGQLYSRARIQDYWIVNLIQRQIEIHRQPTPDGYRQVIHIASGETAQPLLIPDVRIAVDDLLP